MKPFLKWAGNKQSLMPQLERLLPLNINDYYEPFLGSGAVFFHINRRVKGEAFLSDVNAGLVNLFKCLQQGQSTRETLYGMLKELHQKHSPDSDFYLEQRRIYNSTTKSGLYQAARFLYLNKACFNGLWRENRKGEFNTPSGKRKKPSILDFDSYTDAGKCLSKATVYCEGFETIMSRYFQQGDFIYLDPPYHPTSGQFTSYSANGFSREDQSKLAYLAQEAANKGAKVMVSNSWCEFTLNLYNDFYAHQIKSVRKIKGGKHQEEIEALFTSY